MYIIVVVWLLRPKPPAQPAGLTPLSSLSIQLFTIMELDELSNE